MVPAPPTPQHVYQQKPAPQIPSSVALNVTAAEPRVERWSVGDMPPSTPQLTAVPS